MGGGTVVALAIWRLYFVSARQLHDLIEVVRKIGIVRQRDIPYFLVASLTFKQNGKPFVGALIVGDRDENSLT